MLTREDILALFKETNAILHGHFKLSSGLHSDQYLQCALVLQHPEHCARLCGQLAQKFNNDGITAVIAPALGGIVVSYEVARALGVRALFTERKDGTMVLRRGFQLSKRDTVVVVEDVITTGLSTKEVIAIVQASGATIKGIGALVDRSSAPIDFGVRFERCIKLAIPTFDPKECPLCKQGVPITKPGSRA
jgi:orotate phosphoribosyltransferase